MGQRIVGDCGRSTVSVPLRGKEGAGLMNVGTSPIYERVSFRPLAG